MTHSTVALLALSLSLALSGCAIPAPPVSERTTARLVAVAEGGNAEAQYHLGMFYNNGMGGMPRDSRQALAWFRKSADGGDPLGAYKLGCYYAGQFTGTIEPDDEAALRYKLVAAEAGYALAQMDVAGAYYFRHDYARSELWWKRAADQGMPGAQYGLHTLYQKGLVDGRKDPAMAYARFKLANRLPDGGFKPAAQTSLGYLAEPLTPAQLQEADAFVAAFEARPTPLTLQVGAWRKRVGMLVASREPPQ